MTANMINDHRLAEVLHRDNQGVDSRQAWAQIFSYRFLGGWLHDGDAVEIHR